MNIDGLIKEKVNSDQKIKRTIPVPSSSVYDLVLQRISCRSQCRIAWLRMLWIEASKKNNEEIFNYHSEVDVYLCNRDIPEAEARWIQNEKSLQKLNEEIKQAEETLRNDDQSRLAQLKKKFRLMPSECDILQCCLAVELDPNLERVYAYLQDHKSKGYVTKQLVARLFNYGRTLAIPSSSPLYIYGLVKEADMGKGEQVRLYCDPFILDWLLGANSLDPELATIAKWQPVHSPLSHWPVKSTLEAVKKLMARNESMPLRIFIAGQEGSGRRTFAALVCAALKLKLLAADTEKIAPHDWPRLYRYAHRQVLLSGCALLWHGKTAIENGWPDSYDYMYPQFIVGEVDESVLPSWEIIDWRVEMPPMGVENTYELSKQFIPEAAGWPMEELKQMFRRRQPNIGQLIMAAKKEIGSVQEAAEVLRSATRQRLGDLASQLNSSFTWDDLIIPAPLRNNLNDFYFEATERALVWEAEAMKRLFPRGRGLVALFTGMPGTGKTMAAQVLANSLQLDLFRIDLSSIVSKYIGETSKNVERILTRAKRMDIVLFFDEADALFGKRTEVKDAHDRYANTDTNYLLQAIEEYPGIIILATNRHGNMDYSFTRRIRYVLEFPKPDGQQRLELWRRLLAEICGPVNTALLDKELVKLAPTLEITGAQIKSSVLSAIFMAQRNNTPITIIHLLRGAERELSKENRGLGRYGQELLKQSRL